MDGREIKYGVLYRSDHLDKITKRDFDKVAALGVKTVYDLRGEEERESYPQRLPEIVSVEVVSLPIFYQGLDPYVTARRIVISGDVEEGEFHQVMIEAYRAYVLDFRSQWSLLLQGLAMPGTLPALIHCTYGKDRTGVAVAIILRSLGVPREKVVEDYLLSNKFWESKTELYSCLANCASCFRTSRSEVRALMEVRPEYLQAAFLAIDEHYSSFDNYLYQGLGIDEPTLQRLRAALLE
jgi:protein-tyrosine phosphatase